MYFVHGNFAEQNPLVPFGHLIAASHCRRMVRKF